MKFSQRVWIVMLSGVIALALLIPVGLADQYPERESSTYIVDPQDLLSTDAPERATFRETFVNSDQEYILVVTDSTLDDGSAYAAELIDYYTLPANHMLFVLELDDTPELFYTYGSLLTDKGLAATAVDAIIAHHFNYFAVDGNYLTGIRNVIRAIEREELQTIDANETADATETASGNTAGTAQGEAENTASGSPWLKIIFVILVILAALWFVGLVYRRLIYKEINRLDYWRENLENRTFAEQLARVRGLKMAGETEVYFDKWKARWDDVLKTTLPRVDNILLDIEDDAQMFRMIRCKKMLTNARRTLKDAENALQTIVTEIDDLSSSQNRNSKLAEKLNKQWVELQSVLHKKSVDLGIAFPVLNEKADKVEHSFEQYKEAQKSGDYYQAQELLELTDERIQELIKATEQMPALIRDYDYEIPSRLKKLRAHMQKMEEEGYPLDKTGVEHQLGAIESSLGQTVRFIENCQIDDLNSWKEDIMNSIEEMHHKLQTEADARTFVFSQFGSMEPQLDTLREQYHAVGEEVEKIKQSYTWDADLEDSFNQIKEQYAHLSTLVEKSHAEEEHLKHNYRTVKPWIEEFMRGFQSLFDHMKDFENQLQSLREDELMANQVAEELRRKMVRMRTRLQKSNVPGYPEYIQSGFTVAEQSILDLSASLGQVPLDMNRVQHQLKDAETQVTDITEGVEDLLGYASTAEFLIQYANRYRRTDMDVRDLLESAESSFRKYEYEEAVELAEEALDLVDGEWRDKVDLERYQVNMNSNLD